MDRFYPQLALEQKQQFFVTYFADIQYEHCYTIRFFSTRHLVLAEIIDDYQVAILFSNNASKYKSGKTIADLKDEHAFGAVKTIIKIFMVEFKVYLYLLNENV